MFVVQISLLIVTFLSLISQNLSLTQTTKEVGPHPRIAPCVNMWSVTFLLSWGLFFFLCHLLNVDACACHIAHDGQVEWTFVLFQNATCYTHSIVSCIHVNNNKLNIITCTLVATSVILQSLECITMVIFSGPTRTNTHCLIMLSYYMVVGNSD